MYLFTYGTLMDPIQLAAVCGRAPAGAEPATLRGFVRYETRFGYPVIFPAPDCAGAAVTGVLWPGLTGAELAALDEYEDLGIAYVRRQVRVETARGPVAAWAYIGIPEYFRSALL